MCMDVFSFILFHVYVRIGMYVLRSISRSLLLTLDVRSFLAYLSSRSFEEQANSEEVVSRVPRVNRDLATVLQRVRGLRGSSR